MDVNTNVTEAVRVTCFRGIASAIRGAISDDYCRLSRWKTRLTEAPEAGREDNEIRQARPRGSRDKAPGIS
jgi:hypothetical protein